MIILHEGSDRFMIGPNSKDISYQLSTINDVNVLVEMLPSGGEGRSTFCFRLKIEATNEITGE